MWIPMCSIITIDNWIQKPIRLAFYLLLVTFFFWKKLDKYEFSSELFRHFKWFKKMSLEFRINGLWIGWFVYLIGCSLCCRCRCHSILALCSSMLNWKCEKIDFWTAFSVCLPSHHNRENGLLFAFINKLLYEMTK